MPDVVTTGRNRAREFAGHRAARAASNSSHSALSGSDGMATVSPWSRPARAASTMSSGEAPSTMNNHRCYLDLLGKRLSLQHDLQTTAPKVGKLRSMNSVYRRGSKKGARGSCRLLQPVAASTFQLPSPWSAWIREIVHSETAVEFRRYHEVRWSPPHAGERAQPCRASKSSQVEPLSTS